MQWREHDKFHLEMFAIWNKDKKAVGRRKIYSSQKKGC